MSTTDVQNESKARDTAVEDLKDTPALRAQRESLRQRGKAKIRAALASTSAFTQADYDSYIRDVLTDEGLERGGAHTGQKKLEWLKETVNLRIPEVINQVQQLENDFFRKLSQARMSGWISSASEQRWRERLASSSVLWYNKKTFLTQKFPTYFKNWETLDADEKKLTAKVKQLKLSKKEVPELAAFLDPTFRDNKYSAKKVIVDNALAAVGAFHEGKQDFHKAAESMLLKAVSKGVLSPQKVSEWMRRIFASGHDEKTISKFLAGEGKFPLPHLINQWTEVKNRYDKIEELRDEKKPEKFHFVGTDQFLNWHYDTRLAYVNEAERRLNTQSGQNVILGDIRRELDMKDWGSADYLVKQAEKMSLSAEEKEELRSMQRYLQTQQTLEPQTVASEGEDPRQDMYKALAELKNISGPIYDLYTKAMMRGYGTFAALSSLMYNRCWVRRHHYMDDDRETRLREQAKEQTQEVVDHGHTRGFENNYVPGYKNPAIRDQDDGEWAPQVLHLSSDEGAENAVINKCESQQNNHSFKYWTTLIPENLSYEHHEYIVNNLNWRIKSAMRSGPISQNLVHRKTSSSKTNAAESSLSLAA